MSSILPQYSKIPDAEQDTEDDRLLSQAGELDGSRPTYPPFAPSSATGLSGSAAPTSTPSTFQLPPHLARYKLEERNFVIEGGDAVCTRGASREDTIASLLSDFPKLADRDPATIKFCVALPPPAGSPTSGPGSGVNWMPVSDALWTDLIVQGKPDNILIRVQITKAEERSQCGAALCAMTTICGVTAGLTAFIMLFLGPAMSKTT